MRVLWVPGWSYGPEMWQDAAKPFLDRGDHHFLSFHHCREPADYHALVAEKAQGDWLAVAWSLGSLLVMVRALACPPRGLFLIGATGGFTAGPESPWGWPESMVLRLKGRLAKKREKALADFDRQVFAPQEPPVLSGLRPPQPSLQAGLDVLLSTRVLAEAGRITCPVFFYHGAADKVCPLAGMEALAAAMPASLAFVRPEEGHGAFLQDPTPMQEALRRFFDECHL